MMVSLNYVSYLEVFLDPGVRGLPVLGTEVTVRVAAGQVFDGHATGGKVRRRREVLRNALHRL